MILPRLSRRALRFFGGEGHPPGRLAYLDGFRALAIGGVLIDHFVTSQGYNAGRLGVELFFVLSGRLMAQILFIEQVPLGFFYYRRFSRVWPTMALFIAVLAILPVFMSVGQIPATAVLSSLTYTSNYVTLTAGRFPWTDHLWSLCVEEHTYLYLGLIAVLHRRWRLPFLPVLFVTVVLNQLSGWISTLVFDQDYYHTYWRTDVRMSSILLGAIAFLLSRAGVLRIQGGWVVALFVIGVILNAKQIPDPIKYSFGTACLAIAVVRLDAAAGWVKRGLSAPLMVWVGIISYSVYLWQQPFVTLYRGGLPGQLACLAAAMVTGYASFRLLENPLRRWLNAHPPRWARRPAAAVPPAGSGEVVVA